LLKILERIEYDRPILMQDKLDIIWGDEQLPNGTSPRERRVEDDNDSKLFNQNDVKRRLTKIKSKRMLTNQKHIAVYNKMLDYLEKRFETIAVQEEEEKRNNPPRTRIHEKERQFMETFRVIIQSGYTIDEKDLAQILDFINVKEVLLEDETKVRHVRNFMVTVAKGLGFSDHCI
jgi:hypothetical protein